MTMVTEKHQCEKKTPTKSICNCSRKINKPTRRSEMIKKLKAKSKTQFPQIPEEILVTILSKLPVKSLLRFRCVSKSFFSLISDPKFKISSSKERAIVLSKPDSPDFSILLINDDASSIKLPKPEPATLKGRRFSRYWTIRGSCNGLVLLSSYVDLFLWNPLTRCCKKVLSHAHLQKFHYTWNASGLCYDSSTDDYKVVMSCLIWSRELGYDTFGVGSCRSKTWTQVCLPYYQGNVKSGPTVNERLHFLVTKSSSNERDTTFLVVSFDARANKFVEVPMPKGKRGKSALGLGVSDGCLCLALWTEHMSPNENELEVFVMKKYGDRASWITLFVRSKVNGLFRSNVNTFSGWLPLCFTKNAIVLMLLHTSLVRRICSSNGEFTSCQDIRVENNNCSYGSKATLVESLVSPPSYNWEEKDEYTEIFLSGLAKKWKRERGNVAFKIIDRFLTIQSI